MQFPEMTNDRLDSITRRCRMGDFESVKALADEAAILEEARSLPLASAWNFHDILKIRQRWRCLVEEGLLDVAGTASKGTDGTEQSAVGSGLLFVSMPHAMDPSLDHFPSPWC